MISVVINTLNEADKLSKVINSVKGLADEIVVCDMESSDNTPEVAKRLGAKVYSHKKEKYVELVRNFMIAKAKGEWVLILDVDEELPKSLIKKLKEIVKKPQADYYRLPRKNIIFGKWIKHSRWWPDYHIRFFKKGFVSWNEVIHSVPLTKGKGLDLPEKEELAIVHENYSSIEEYLERMNRYTSVGSEELLKSGYVFVWSDLIKRPLNEFLSRFFSGEGYKDGVHGLALAFLQAFSELVLYLKTWQKQGFKEKEITKKEFKDEFKKVLHDLRWWLVRKLTWLKLL